MTEIVFVKNAEHRFTGFESRGHSGFARRGKDYVCASISVLTINTVNSLDELTDAEIDTEVSERDAVIKCRLVSAPNSETELLFKSLELGLLDISKTYGSMYCKVTYKEELTC